MQGTVPYLGTFLTDLTMIDTANSDMTEEGLINFEKHRKEFEVIAQIKLLQSAAQIYSIKEDTQFWVWFDSVRVFDDNERFALNTGHSSTLRFLSPNRALKFAMVYLYEHFLDYQNVMLLYRSSSSLGFS